MPTLPRPGQAPAGGTRASRPSASSGTRERGSGAGSSSTPPPATPRSRTSKVDALQIKLTRMYMMFGTMIRPFGRFYPVLTPIGDNLKTFSEEAAEAWIELAQEDKRVMEMLESMTKASTWGSVIGIHFAIFASSIPGGEYVSQVMEGMPVDLTNDPIAAARAAGMSEEDIAAATQMAANMMGATATPARDQSSGGPGDTVKVPPAPEFQPAAGAPSAAPPPVQSTAPISKAAIVTPAELGVTMPGEQSPFPQSTGLNGGGGGVA